MTTEPTQGSEALDGTAYAEAMQMVRYEGTMVWQRFSAFLIAHSLFTALLAHSIIDARVNRGLAVAGCIGGVLLCLVWLCTFVRGNAFFDLRIAQARQFEPPTWKIIGDIGEGFSEGYQVIVNGKPRRMHPIGRLRMRHGVYAAICVIAATYITLGVATLLRST